MLTAALVLVLALVLPAWAAALIVAGALFVLAGIAVLIAKARFQRNAPMPSPAIDAARTCATTPS